MDNRVEKIWDEATSMKAEHPEWRWGQCVFNATHQLYPKQADLYRGTISDCFYRDDLIDVFLKQIENTIGNEECTKP